MLTGAGDPSKFPLAPDGSAALNQDASLNTLECPAKPGSVVVLFGTGAGQTNPPSIDGQISAPPRAEIAAPVTVVVNGPATQVPYAGAAPGLAVGMFRVNIRLPADVPAGAVHVVAQVGSQTSPTVTIAIR